MNAQVRFSIHQEQTNAIIDAVQSGKWDVGFCSNEIDIGGITALSDNVAIMLRTPSLREFQDLVVLPMPEVPEDFRIVHMVFNKKSYKVHAVENFIDYFAARWSYSPESRMLQQFYLTASRRMYLHKENTKASKFFST